MAFYIFLFIGILFLVVALRIYYAKKPINMWANDTSKMEVSDVTKYNHAVGRLVGIYACLLVIAGVPLYKIQQNSPTVVVTVLLVVFGTLGMIICYTFIEGKYRK